jgi:hypothetical protein
LTIKHTSDVSILPRIRRLGVLLKDADELELQHEPVTSRRNTAELYSPTIRRLHRNCQSCHFTVLALNDSEDPLTSLRAPEALPYETAYEPSHGFEDQQTPLSASKSHIKIMLIYARRHPNVFLVHSSVKLISSISGGYGKYWLG